MFSDAYFWLDFFALTLVSFGLYLGWSVTKLDESEELSILIRERIRFVLYVSAYPIIFWLVGGFMSGDIQKLFLAACLFQSFQLLRICFLIRDKRQKSVPHLRIHRG